jgi:hypothetical protein
VPAELQENGPNDPTTLCIVHSGVNSKLIKYFIYFRLHPWTGRSFENPLRPIHKRCGQPLMDKVVILLVICLTTVHCTADKEEVIVSQYSFKNHLVSEDTFYVTIEKTNDYFKYRLIDDSSKLQYGSAFQVSSLTDSIMFYGDLELKLMAKKVFQIASSSYEVLKYEDSEREMTVCFNRNYGPIISRGNHYKGHETYDRPKQEERLLIEIIRNDSINFGGI